MKPEDVYKAIDKLCEKKKEEIHMTNGDRIRQMTDDELVMALETDCNRCAESENCELRGDPVDYGDCVKGNIKWLKTEVQLDEADNVMIGG